MDGATLRPDPAHVQDLEPQVNMTNYSRGPKLSDYGGKEASGT